MPARDEAVETVRTVVLVEGISDQLAVTALARRWSRNLLAEGVAVLPMHGATNIGHFLERYGPQGLDVGLAGLCDRAEMRFFLTGFEQAGLGRIAGRAELENQRFFVCDADLEDELIAALGVDAVEQILAAQGDIVSYRKFQRQPAQREKPDRALLSRFMGTRGDRKIRDALVLVNALASSYMPRPLAELVAAV